MPAKLVEGKKIRREVKIYGIDLPCNATLSTDGIEIKVRGSKVGVFIAWLTVVGRATTPGNVPSKFEGSPFAFLQDTARRLTATLIRRLDKEARGKTNA